MIQTGDLSMVYRGSFAQLGLAPATPQPIVIFVTFVVEE